MISYAHSCHDTNWLYLIENARWLSSLALVLVFSDLRDEKYYLTIGCAFDKGMAGRRYAGTLRVSAGADCLRERDGGRPEE